MPARVDPLQLSVSVPSRLAAAASSLRAALISWAGAGTLARNASAADRAIRDRNDLRAGTEPSRAILSEHSSRKRFGRHRLRSCAYRRALPSIPIVAP